MKFKIEKFIIIFIVIIILFYFYKTYRISNYDALANLSNFCAKPMQVKAPLQANGYKSLYTYSGNPNFGFICNYWVIVAGIEIERKIKIYGIKLDGNSQLIIDDSKMNTPIGFGGNATIIPTANYKGLKIELYYDLEDFRKNTFNIPVPSNINNCFYDTWNKSNNKFSTCSTLTNCFIINAISASVYCDTPLVMVPNNIFSYGNLKKVAIKHGYFRIKDNPGIRLPRDFSIGMVNV